MELATLLMSEDLYIYSKNSVPGTLTPVLLVSFSNSALLSVIRDV
jgi:hypothetical protein